MGSCVSVHKSSQSAMELKMSTEYKTDGVSDDSHTKDDGTAINREYPVGEMGFKPQTSSVLPVTSLQDLLNSKEDMFFDSLACLESDCEDFVSVDGDLTPPHGSSPVHQSSLMECPSHDRSPFVDRQLSSVFESSPTDKKRLVEFFHEGEPVDGDKKLQGRGRVIASAHLDASPISDLLPRFVDESPCTSVPNSGCSSQRTPNRRTRSEKVNLALSARWCLPSVGRSLSVSGRRKKGQSPAQVSEG